MANLLVVISGPAGVGKGTIVKEIIRGDSSRSLSVSCTTRSPREGEEEGVSYFFTTKEKFSETAEAGGFLEYSEHFGNFYGTPRAFVEERLKTGDVILEIDVNGALQIKAAYPDALLIMIVPPSIDVLKERILGRKNDAGFNLEDRLSRVDFELSQRDKYDATVINDDLTVAVNEVLSIIEDKKKEMEHD
ncbi:MAG: guanylate kinase [Clostridia bacterium]|nr:guanylate kinase [Clostridia bacterium]